jgi:adenylate cyclase
LKHLVDEMKRRKVFRAAVVYVATAFVILQAADIMLPRLGVPDWAMSLVVVFVVLGFPLTLVLAWALELTPEGIKRTESAVAAGEAGAAAPALLSKWTVLAASALVILGIGLGAGWFLRPSTSGPAATRSDQPGALAGAPALAASIAVLPFADMSPGGDQEYFSDGMAEEILNALARVGGLRVASRTSSFAFKDQQSLGLRAIAGELSVRHVLEGSVRRAGETIRITAQLIDAEEDAHLWSDTYDRPLTAENIFAIQDEIATAIVAALIKSLRLDSVGEVRLGMATENLTAYDLYLRARAFFQARTRLDEADALLQRALEQDPKFAKAWELRAAVQGVARSYGYSDLDQGELDRLGLEYGQRALDIDPGSGLALASMAFQRASAVQELRTRHDIGDILRDLHRALDLDPGNSSTLNWLGLAHGFVGELDNALGTFQRCLEHDPLFAPCAENEYEALFALGRLEPAYARFQVALDRGLLTAQYANFALLAHFGQRDAFMLMANQSGWLQGWRDHGAIYDAYQDLAGDHTALVGEILRFKGLEEGGGAGYLAHLLIPLGAHDLLPVITMLMWGPDHGGYRRSPQFRNYIRESGVLAYWRAHSFPPQCRPRGRDDFACN